MDPTLLVAIAGLIVAIAAAVSSFQQAVANRKMSQASASPQVAVRFLAASAGDRQTVIMVIANYADSIPAHNLYTRLIFKARQQDAADEVRFYEYYLLEPRSHHRLQICNARDGVGELSHSELIERFYELHVEVKYRDSAGRKYRYQAAVSTSEIPREQIDRRSPEDWAS